eukprot:766762-Hanusia_phi.AAC.2
MGSQHISCCEGFLRAVGALKVDEQCRERYLFAPPGRGQNRDKGEEFNSSLIATTRCRSQQSCGEGVRISSSKHELYCPHRMEHSMQASEQRMMTRGHQER